MNFEEGVLKSILSKTMFEHRLSFIEKAHLLRILQKTSKSKIDSLSKKVGKIRADLCDFRPYCISRGINYSENGTVKQLADPKKAIEVSLDAFRLYLVNNRKDLAPTQLAI
jgi:hypothetical protein